MAMNKTTLMAFDKNPVIKGSCDLSLIRFRIIAVSQPATMIPMMSIKIAKPIRGMAFKKAL